ncbi:MAG: hypothetical protein ACRD6W_10390 [Nitrososphaerales archaeon]
MARFGDPVYSGQAVANAQGDFTITGTVSPDLPSGLNTLYIDGTAPDDSLLRQCQQENIFVPRTVPQVTAPPAALPPATGSPPSPIPVTIAVSTSPRRVVVGDVVTFTVTVTVKGSGALSGSKFVYGDGKIYVNKLGTSQCGTTSVMDITSRARHKYSEPGAYHFTDVVHYLSSLAGCREMTAIARVVVTVHWAHP